MAQKLIIELQDDQGNIYYLHTVATAVFCTDGKTVQDKIGTVKGRIATKDSLKLVTEANYLVEAKAVRDCFDELNGKLTWKRTRALYILGLDTEYDCTIPSGTNDILVVMAVGGASATTMPNNNKTTLLIPYPVLTGVHTISLFDNVSTYLSLKVKFANNKITFMQQNTGSAWTGVRLFAEIYYR